MSLYTFHDLTLEVMHEKQETGDDLASLLQGLSFAKTQAVAGKPSLSLSVRMNGHGPNVPSMAREVFRADGFRGLEAGEDFYLTDGGSLFHLQASKGKGEAHLAPSFFDKSYFLQQNFWAFGLMKLLRPVGIYTLHAAGIVTRKGQGLLLVGESGSGKSTAAIGLIRQEWGYLSDDAVLLRLQLEGVKALALRKNFYVDTSAEAEYSDLPLGEEVPDSSGGRRRRVCIEEAFPKQYVSACLPHMLIFPRIVSQTHSSLLPLDRVSALKTLLAQSGPQLFDKGTMGQHLEVLKKLLQQTLTYELRAGLDLYRDPKKLVHLLTEADGDKKWPVSS